MSKGRVVGEYQVGRQIGSGSFSVVWHGRHRVHGTEVAIKEIATARLNKKLQESLMSEILILQKINHANIIKLHDIIEVPGKIHLVLEYCKGGDLSMYIQHHVRVPEDTAKHFMKQLAAGLKILRENNLIHRDLKPQNLLLSTTDSKSVLKIADFGFARSLQPRGLAETLCGSPLYMAPEIMQLQKYDAKADLWSVGAILFQLVVGKTPFSGNNQIQLLQNIIRSVELHFPPDISTRVSAECKDLCRKLLRRNPVERLTFEEFFNHPFLEEETTTTTTTRRMNVGSGRKEISFRGRRSRPPQDDSMQLFLDDDFNISPEMIPPISPEMILKSEPHRPPPEQAAAVVDSLELEGYVFVSGSPSTVISSSSSKPALSLSPARASFPMQMIGFPTTSGVSHPPLESTSSAATTGHPPSSYAVRIKSLCEYASAITDLVAQKVETGKQLEAFSVQLVSLAVWKQALHICHTNQAASAAIGEGSPHQWSADIQEEFLREVDRAEELSSALRDQATDVEMPDAIATIYQSALAFGRHGAVDELMGNTENAQRMYSRAVGLLHFLLMEAPTLILNPPFSLTNADRYRLRTYVEAIRARCTSHRD